MTRGRSPPWSRWTLGCETAAQNTLSCRRSPPCTPATPQQSSSRCNDLQIRVSIDDSIRVSIDDLIRGTFPVCALLASRAKTHRVDALVGVALAPEVFDAKLRHLQCLVLEAFNGKQMETKKDSACVMCVTIVSVSLFSLSRQMFVCFDFKYYRLVSFRCVPLRFVSFRFVLFFRGCNAPFWCSRIAVVPVTYLEHSRIHV